MRVREPRHKSLECAGEPERHFGLVRLKHRGSGVLADVKGFIERKTNPYRLRNLSLCDLFFVHQQCRGGTLANATASVLELNADDVIAGRQRLIGNDAILVLRLIGIGVGEFRLAILLDPRPQRVRLLPGYDPHSGGFRAGLQEQIVDGYCANDIRGRKGHPPESPGRSGAEAAGRRQPRLYL